MLSNTEQGFPNLLDDEEQGFPDFSNIKLPGESGPEPFEPWKKTHSDIMRAEKTRLAVAEIMSSENPPQDTVGVLREVRRMEREASSTQKNVQLAEMAETQDLMKKYGLNFYKNSINPEESQAPAGMFRDKENINEEGDVEEQWEDTLPMSLNEDASIEELSSMLKQRYIFDQAVHNSLLGMAYRATFDIKDDDSYNEAIEKSLGWRDKITREFVSLATDLPILPFGGIAIKGITKGLQVGSKVAPWLIKAIPKLGAKAEMWWHGTATMGLYSGTRQVYYDHMQKGEVNSVQDWLTRSQDAFIETVKGGIVGGIGGYGSALRMGRPAVKQVAMLFPESLAIATAMSQMEDPLSLPGFEDFTAAMAADMGIESAFMMLGTKKKILRKKRYSLETTVGVEFGDGKSLSPEMVALSDHAESNAWYAEKYEKAYIGYGVHPGKLADDSYNDLGVMHSLTDPTSYNIKPYDVQAGNYTSMMPGEDVIAAARAFKNDNAPIGVEQEKSTISKVGEQTEGVQNRETIVDGLDPEAGIAKDQVREAESDVPAPLGAVVIGSPVPAGVINPMGFGPKDSYQIISAGGTKRVAAPVTPEQALSFTPEGRLEVPVLVHAILDMTKGMYPKLTDIDPKDPGVMGSFSPAELGRKRRLVTLKKRIDSLERLIIKEEDAGFDPIHSKKLQADLKKERYRIADSDLTLEETAINVSRQVVSGGPVKEAPSTPAEMKGRILGTLTHELGHLISYVSADWKTGGSEINQSLGRQLFGFGDVSKNFQETVTGLEQVVRQKVFAEAEAISIMWRPTSEENFRGDTAYGKYRRLPAEIMADVNSAILNNPDMARQVAPTLMRAWDNFLNERPTAADTVNGLIKTLDEGISLDKAAELIAGDEYGFGRAEKFTQLQDELKAAKNEPEFDLIWDSIVDNLFDSSYSALKYANASDALRNTMERYQFKGTVVYNYVDRVVKEVVLPFRKAGVSNRDIGLLLFFRRNMGDPERRMLVNAFGFDADTSTAMYEKMYKEFSDRVDTTVLLEHFNGIRQEEFVKLAEESGFYTDKAIEVFKDNETYARIDLVKYFEQRTDTQGRSGGTGSADGDIGGILTTQAAALRKQKGSFEGIVNPLSSTIQNDAMLIESILKQTAMRDVVKEMQANNGPVMSGAEYSAYSRRAKLDPHFDEQKWDIFDSMGLKDADMAPIEFAQRIEVDGKVKVVPAVFYVPRSVAENFKGSARFIQSYLKLANASFLETKGLKGKALVGAAKGFKDTTDFFRFMAITANMSFQTANITYDASRTYYNTPTVEGKPIRSFIPLGLTGSHYIDAIKSQYSMRRKGTRNDVWEEMRRKGLMALSARYGEDVSGSDISDRVMGKYTSTELRDANIGTSLDRVVGFGKSVVEGMQGILNFTEGVQNEAGYRFLKANQDKLISRRGGEKKVGLSDDEVERIARDQLGPPAYRRRGNYTTIGNVLVPFSNSAKEGIRGDFEAFNNNRPAYVAKLFIGTIVPSIAATLMEAGLFDSEEMADMQGGTWSDILETQSEFYKSTRVAIPLALNANEGKGLVMGVPLPLSPVQRTVHSVTRQMVKMIVKLSKEGDVDSKELLNELLALASETVRLPVGDLPGFSPVVKLATSGHKVLFGENVTSTYQNGGDYFTGEEINRMNAEDFGDKARERLKGFVRFSSDSLAIPIVGKVLKEHKVPLGYMEAMDNITNAPPGSGFPYYAKQASRLTGAALGWGFSGYVKYGDGGIREKNYLLGQKDKSEQASARMRSERNIDNAQDRKTLDIQTPKDIDALRRELKKRIPESIANPYYRAFMEAKSPRQKAYAFERAKRLMPRMKENKQ